MQIPHTCTVYTVCTITTQNHYIFMKFRHIFKLQRVYTLSTPTNTLLRVAMFPRLDVLWERMDNHILKWQMWRNVRCSSGYSCWAKYESTQEANNLTTTCTKLCQTWNLTPLELTFSDTFEAHGEAPGDTYKEHNKIYIPGQLSYKGMKMHQKQHYLF